MILRSVRAFCHEHSLLAPGPLVVAVSGGADSITLLHVLIDLRSMFGIEPHVATFDHQIRGSAGAADVQFVCNLAREWGVPVTTGTADVPALAREWSSGLEAAARRVRYAFLAETAHAIGAKAIATGH